MYNILKKFSQLGPTYDNWWVNNAWHVSPGQMTWCLSGVRDKGTGGAYFDIKFLCQIALKIF